MGMILRIASSRIVGQGDIVGRSGYFSLNLSANSVMRGRLDARRTLKSLVADLRFISYICQYGSGWKTIERHARYRLTARTYLEVSTNRKKKEKYLYPSDYYTPMKN